MHLDVEYVEFHCLRGRSESQIVGLLFVVVGQLGDAIGTVALAQAHVDCGNPFAVAERALEVLLV